MTTETTTRNDGAPAAPGPTGIAQRIGTRNLLIVIVTMPLVFLMVVIASLAIFGKPGGKARAVAAAASVRSEPSDHVLSQPDLAMAGALAPKSVAAAAPSPLILPSGGDITAMAIDGDRLVLRVKGNSGGSIVVYDLARGAEIQRIRVLENPASAGEDL